jgi:O-antigen ligase
VNEYDEYAHNRNINGHSLTMRPYFWSAAWHVIKQHFLFGVGTGDVQQELNSAYADIHSPLWPEWHKRPHNQFLAITVALGSIGLLILCWSIIYPAIRLKKYMPVLFWPFLIIALISFLMEDTLESQAGLTFYAVFNTLFLSVAWFRKKDQLLMER